MNKMKGTVIPVICSVLMFFLFLQPVPDRKNGESARIENVMIPAGDGTYIKAEFSIPQGAEYGRIPAVVLNHGFAGSMDSAGIGDLSHNLAGHGIAAVRMDFAHRISEDPDSRMCNSYTVDTMVSDAVLCVDYMISHYGADPDRIGIFGRSMGARAAMKMANEKAGGYDYRGLVLVAPAGDGEAFFHYMGGRKKWNVMKKEAAEKGSILHQKVRLYPDFFASVEAYTPSDYGYKFKNPVLLFYNTEDYVVLPETAEKCGTCYPDCEMVQISSKKSPHGLEMGFEESEIKDMIFEEITEFYKQTLAESGSRKN